MFVVRIFAIWAPGELAADTRKDRGMLKDAVKDGL